MANRIDFLNASCSGAPRTALLCILLLSLWARTAPAESPRDTADAGPHPGPTAASSMLELVCRLEGLQAAAGDGQIPALRAAVSAAERSFERTMIDAVAGDRAVMEALERLTAALSEVEATLAKEREKQRAQ